MTESGGWGTWGATAVAYVLWIVGIWSGAIAWGTRSIVSSSRAKRATLLAITAGWRGWSLIEYQELLASAREYVGEAHCVSVSVRYPRTYVKELREALHPDVTHVVLSPRTGLQSWWGLIVQGFALLVMSEWKRIVPIVILSDIQDRRRRIHAIIVTARRGVIATFASPTPVKKHFPHSRIMGPCLMPFSMASLSRLESLSPPSFRMRSGIVFVGSLYEPRSTRLAELSAELSVFGLELVRLGRASLDAPRIDAEDYWAAMLGARFVVTTTTPEASRRYDWHWLNHLVYRSSEALACGAVLVVESVIGMERLFTGGEDFVLFTDAQSTAQAIVRLSENVDDAQAIAASGHKRLRRHCERGGFWGDLDVALGADAIGDGALPGG